MNKHVRIVRDRSEGGSANVKLVIFLVVVLLAAYAGWNYVPVAYNSADLKQKLQSAVVQGMAPGRGETPLALVRKKVKLAVSKSLAPEALVKVQMVNNVVHANVRYTKKVNILPFGIYQYDYVFNHTATPSGLLFD